MAIDGFLQLSLLGAVPGNRADMPKDNEGRTLKVLVILSILSLLFFVGYTIAVDKGWLPKF